jgi:hypothetical protein
MRRREGLRRSRISCPRSKMSSISLSRRSRLCRNLQKRVKKKLLPLMAKQPQQGLKRRYLFVEMNSQRNKESESRRLPSSRKIGLRSNIQHPLRRRISSMLS